MSSSLQGAANGLLTFIARTYEQIYHFQRNNQPADSNHSNDDTDHEGQGIGDDNAADADNNADTTVGQKRQREKRSGPCHFGHTTTSLRYRGAPSWQANPSTSFWKDVKAGVTLCYKYYNVDGGKRRWEETDVLPST